MLLVMITGIRSQPPQYKLQTFGTRDGLLSSKIFSLLQAKDRKLWIGTEFGASVYDGYSFTNYQYSFSNEPIGRILCLTEDSLKGIWMGGDKGLFYLKDNILQQVMPNKNISIAVEALLTDADGNVWIGDINALYKISTADIKKMNGSKESKIALVPFANFTKRVFGLAADDEQNIYIGSYDAVYKIPAGNKQYEVVWHNP
ncbi:MAG TPA: two-component regulator propeller domain-containing protein, partial [Ferruginibacter sp.]|nr:two-component regulator propeller domain-containing protein [Ferruginibacter sp.]